MHFNARYKLYASNNSCTLTRKQEFAKEVSDKLYEAVIKSVENLAESIKKKLQGKNQN